MNIYIYINEFSFQLNTNGFAQDLAQVMRNMV